MRGVETPATTGLTLERRPLELFAAAAAFILPLAYSPNLQAGFWTPKFVILFLLAAVGAPILVGLAVRGDHAAQAGLGFLLVAGASAAFSSRPLLSLLGLYGWGTGLIFWAAGLAAWAIGRTLRTGSVPLVQWALLSAAAVNAVLGVLQTTVDLSTFGLDPYAGRGYGLLGNPVHLGALMTGSCALVAHTWPKARPSTSAALMFLFAAGLQASGTRIALLAGSAMILLALPGLKAWSSRTLLVAAFAGGLVLTAAVPALPQSSTLTTRLSASEATGGLTPRIETWVSARHAIAERPLLGTGPGRFREATAKYRTLPMVRAEGIERIFVDAHNLLVELAVVTGLAGLGVFLIWALYATRCASHPLIFFAAGVALVGLAQPLTVGTGPMAFLALGAASSGQRWAPTRPIRVVRGMLVAAALVVGGMVLKGDFAARQAALDFELPDAEAAERLLPAWPQPAALLAKVLLYQSILAAPDDPVLVERSVVWRTDAAARDPSDPASWNELGELQLVVPDLEGAARSFGRALDADPQSFRARLGLAQVAIVEGDDAAALRHLAAAAKRATKPAELRAIEHMRAKAKALGSK